VVSGQWTVEDKGRVMPRSRPTRAAGAYRTEDVQTLKAPGTFFELLDDIRQRPGMYLGYTSLRTFRAWLDGFRFARHQAGLPLLEGEAEFDGFDAFVSDKFDWHDTGGWAAKIAYYHRDDAEALDEFFKLLNEYRAGLRAKAAPAG
jgi:hypothetical protein